MKDVLRKRLQVVLLGSLLTSTWAAAQEGIEPPEEEEVFELSAFEVVTTNDRGYLSTNAVSGTSLNMAIRDIPMPLEVINQEFIEDLQATDLEEALDYSSGVFTQTFANGSGANAQGSAETSPSASVSVNNPFANSISIRGYSVPNQQRFGFRVGGFAVGEGFSVVLGGATDTLNARRLEVVRGPASLLYGVNVLSGIVNIMPKRPLSEPRANIGLSMGSHGFMRGTVDFTGPLIKNKLNYRIMGAYEERDHFTDFRGDRKEYLAGQVEWQINRTTRLLTEIQWADQLRNGIGPQYFRDTVGGSGTNNIDFRNKYGEFVQWGREDMSDLMDRDESDPDDVWLIRKTNPMVPYSYGNLGDSYRISGPDTYFQREELNALVLLETRPLEGLSLELGGYYTKIDQEQFTIVTNSVTGSEASIRPSDLVPFPIISQQNFWIRNPEVLDVLGLTDVPDGPIRSKYGLDEAVGFSVTTDDIPYIFNPGSLLTVTSGGIGEVFAVPDRSLRAQLPDDPPYNTTNVKFARYNWIKTPTEAESIQLRLRAAYEFETGIPFINGGTIKHTIIGGYQYTKDDLMIVSGRPGVPDMVTQGQITKRPDSGAFTNGRLGDDPYLLRKSVFDYSPIYYNGEPIAIPGSLGTSIQDLGPLLDEYVNDGKVTHPDEIIGHNLARSGWRDVEAEYGGIYGIYQAQLFTDKLTFIAGARQDSYQVEETEQIRLLDGTPFIDPTKTGTQTDIYYGSQSLTTLPFLISGTEPYSQDKWFSVLPDNLNEEIEREMDLLLEGLGEQGTRSKLFEETQKFVTNTAGLSYRITEDLSMYVTYSEGVFPNQGLRDGNNNPIKAEQTTGKEIGFKFDFFDGKISGTVSFFQIERENATWNFRYAPSPRRWIGGRFGDSETEAYEKQSYGNFDAKSWVSGDGAEARVYEDFFFSGYGQPYQQASYGVHEDFFKQAWRDFIGEEPPENLNIAIIEELTGINFLAANDFGVGGSQENLGEVDPYYFADVNRDLVAGKHINENGVDVGLMMQAAFDAALAAKEFDGFSIYYINNGRNGEFGAGNNPSNQTGALVTFKEETIGVDGQIIFSPTNNYQILLTYSHQQREVVGNGFDLAPLIDPVTGMKIVGTKYDSWVQVLGEENFSDPGDPTTFNGNGVNGLDLSFVPEWNVSLWNKYRFNEGPLEGLELAGGVKYYGEAPTSVPIGGTRLNENEFPTPPTPERFEFDASLSYRFTLMNQDCRIALKVNNLLDDRVDEAVVQYEDPDGPINPVYRRTRVYYGPRTYRLQFSMAF
ncbi:MAG: TonB-dependent receptor [Puniceicoccaceae bacterium]